MSLIDAALGVLLATWLAVSALCQFGNPLGRLLRQVDACYLIPQWTFFAPRPAMHDYWFLYRDQLGNGAVTRWFEVPLRRTHFLIAPLWNPYRRHNKALFDIVTQVGLLAGEGREPAQLKLTVPYLALLSFVSALPRDHGAVATQFLIMTSGDSAAGVSPAPVLVSALHALD